MLRHRIFRLLVLVSILLTSLACSSGNPIAPPTGPGNGLSADNAPQTDRWLWGTWEVRINLEEETIQAIPRRTSSLHFNVVPLLREGTPGSLLGFRNLLIDPAGHSLQVDISLEHPFPTLPQVAGFDVRGILYTKGSGYFVQSANARMTAPNEPRLTNADGYTRWWNPTEFKGPFLLSYTDGVYGTPNAMAEYELQLAGYKYFTDSLGPLDSLNDMDSADRGVFRAGETNERRYLIDFGEETGTWLVFNYAVDANWGRIPGFTPGGADPVVPGDFPLTANCPEPYRLRVSEAANSYVGSTVTGTSGTVTLNIDVFDWQAMDPLSTVPMEISTVQIEAPVFGLPPVNATVVPGSGAGGHMSTYTASLTGSSPEKLEFVDIVVSATIGGDDYQDDLTDFLGTDPLQAFNLHRASVRDGDTYSGWEKRFTRRLYPEYPNQGDNPPDIAVYLKQDMVRAAMVDQENPDPNNEGDHHPDSINVWADDYTSYSIPEHYHLPVTGLGDTGKWDDINGICVSDTSTRFFFTNTNIHDELPDGENDPLYSYIAWSSHAYLGNAPAAAWQTAFFSAGNYPRYWATDPCNGVKLGTDYIYSVFVYDTTGMAGGDPGVDPQRYIIFRWKPPYDLSDANADWQRPLNVPPNGSGTGYVDHGEPYTHRLGVDDSTAQDRCYILDSLGEIEVVDCDFSLDEFSGSFPIGTVTAANWPEGVIDVVDLEVVKTKPLGTVRNHIAILCVTDTAQWRVWVIDYDQSQPIDSQGVTQWLSEPYNGTPLSLDACDDPVEVHVLHQNGGLTYVTVFRDYP